MAEKPDNLSLVQLCKEAAWKHRLSMEEVPRYGGGIVGWEQKLIRSLREEELLLEQLQSPQREDLRMFINHTTGSLIAWPPKKKKQLRVLLLAYLALKVRLCIETPVPKV